LFANVQQGHLSLLDLRQQGLYLFIGPVPPGQRLWPGYAVRAKALAWRACHHAVGRYVPRYQATDGDNGAIPDSDAWHYHGFHSYPDIIAYSVITGGALAALEGIQVSKRTGADEGRVVSVVAPAP
jgi:hypothetical protein